MLNNLIMMAMQNKLQSMPEMSIFNQFFSGKSPQDQMNTLLNMASEKGIDINEKMFSLEDLKQLGINPNISTINNKDCLVLKIDQEFPILSSSLNLTLK